MVTFSVVRIAYTNIIIYIIYVYVQYKNNNYRHFRFSWTIWDIITIIIILILLLLLYYCIQLGDASLYIIDRGAWSLQRFQSRCFTFAIIYIILYTYPFYNIYLYIDNAFTCGRCVKRVCVHDWPWTGHRRVVAVVKYDLRQHAFPCRHRTSRLARESA